MPVEKSQSIEEFFSSAANQRAVQYDIRRLYDLGLSVAHIGIGPNVERIRYWQHKKVIEAFFEASRKGPLSDIPFVGVGITPSKSMGPTTTKGTMDFVFKR